MLNEKLAAAIAVVLHNIFPDHAPVGTEGIIIEHPKNPEHGDYSCNIALQLSKVVQKASREVAEIIIENMEKPDFIQAMEIAGSGFINFYVKPAYLVGNLRGIHVAGDKYGHNQSGHNFEGKPKKVLIEYSQPNTNKPMHIGHMRNNFVGMAVHYLLKANGYETIPANYVGDIGIHIAKSMLGYQKWGRNTTPESVGMKGDYFVGKYYQQFEAELQKDESLLGAAQEIVQKWEAGDEEIHELWNRMNQWVYEGWNGSYERQGCHFEKWYYESSYSESGKEVAEESLEKGVAEHAENGAIIAKLEAHGLPDKVLIRGDGTSIYATKDLKLAEDSFQEFGLDGRIYVVASQQKVYLEQIFKILELLGYDYAKSCFHLAYGIVSLPEGMMSSRKGNVIYADDLMEEVHELAYNEVVARHEGESEEWLHDVAEKVTVAALKYGILKVDAFQNIIFDPKDIVQFEGDTGPYIQYTYARIRSIMRKAAGASEGLGNLAVDPETLHEPEELAIMRKLQLFPEVVYLAGQEYRIHSIANYLFDLAQLTNSFYAKHQVLEGPSDELKAARLQLLSAVAKVLKNGLGLLGIEVIERM